MNAIECAFEGRLGGAPTLRTSQAGKPWCALNVVHGKDDAATWLSVAVFGSQAETVAGLEKGALVYIEGRITLDTWQDNEGRERSGLKVAASLVQPLGQIGRKRPAKASATAGALDDPPTSRNLSKRLYAPETGPSVEPRSTRGFADQEIPF
jgi:single-strand DNA-binding protein